MRYSDSHKQETRQKVVKAAAAAMRAKGPDGVGVAEIMAEAGLTHGGFYAHFPNKEALVAAAIEEAFGQSRRRFTRMTEGMSSDEALTTFVRRLCLCRPPQQLATRLPGNFHLEQRSAAPGLLWCAHAFDTGVANLISGRLEAAGLWEQDPRARRSLASSIDGRDGPALSRWPAPSPTRPWRKICWKPPAPASRPAQGLRRRAPA